MEGEVVGVTNYDYKVYCILVQNSKRIVLDDFMNKNANVFKVLSIDGGGMRGYYNALYLDGVKKLANSKFKNTNFINQFGMLVGTSTGAIIACGLANSMDPKEISNLYKEHGQKIFPKKVPTKWWQFLQFINRESINQKGNIALRAVLKEAFNDKTIKQIYDDTRTALVMPSINATTHEGYIFKTPHNNDTNNRDDNIALVDACLASSAAPIYRSLASINNDLFVDGGLYANNPVLVALSEALRITKGTKQKIEIYCLGMSPIAGSTVDCKVPNWGFRKWKFGSKAVNMSIDSQASVFDYLAKEFSNHVDRKISIVRFPQANIAPEHANFLDLDDASEKSLNLMQTLANTAIDNTNQLISDEANQDGNLIKSLLINDSKGN